MTRILQQNQLGKRIEILSVLLTASVLSSAVIAAPLRVAVIYPKDDPKVSSIGNEAACITDGMLAAAKTKGLVSYEFFDNERDPIKTATVAEAIAKARFDLAIGTVTSSEAIAAAQVLNQAKIPFFATTATNPDVTKGKPFSFRLPFDDFRQAHALAQFVIKEQKARKVAIVKNISLPYSEFLASEFIARPNGRNQSFMHREAAS